MTALAATPIPAKAGMGFKQFVAFVAALMAVNALAIDSMLPALPAIGHSLGVEDENRRQLIVTCYLLGFGGAQLVYGPLSDRLGRKTVLITGLLAYVLFAGLAAVSTSFTMLLVSRVLMGVGAAATRVLAVSIVRDCFSGRDMARVMSLAFIVFLASPVFAPSIGQVIMLVGPWRWVFGALCCFAGIVLVWATLRLPETLHPSDRLPFSPRRIADAFRLALSDRIAVGYMLAMTLVMGALFGFINSAQQIFADTLRETQLFTTVFAGIAGAMAVSSFLNARIVGRYGPRRVSHVALCGFIAVSAIHALVSVTGHESLVTFAVLQAAVMFCFGVMAPNFGSISMEPLGHVAGTASSVQGFVQIFGGAVLGFFIGQCFDGTTVPLSMGFIGYGLLALFVVLLAERGRLFGTSRPALAAEGAFH